MFGKNSTESRRNSTRPPRFVTGLKLSRLLKGLAFVAVLKLVVIGALTLDLSTDYFATPWRAVVAAVSGDAASAPARGAAPSAAKSATRAVAKARTDGGLLRATVAEAANSSPGTHPVPGGAPDAAGAPAATADARDISLERDALMRKQEELNRQEQSLKSLQQDIDAKLAKLQELQANIERMLKQADELKDKKLKHLVDVYSNMKAKQAAQVLETLDEKIAVKILAGMRGRQAGEILTFVTPGKAARLSEALTRMQVPFNN
ncbi:MAG: hypothetical protein H0S85_17305 [Desulfovibrionaceae bacterium]|nr:hypothetical protein [Desulfovibrionaceae bacterium]